MNKAAGDIGADPEVPRAEHYPPYVVTPEERRRWDVCEALAEAVFESSEGSAPTRWQMVRSLYASEIPT